jgi:sterol desaturase/sphingolipid hydroxylase (fatty acid hydroxylase superfamily)
MPMNPTLEIAVRLASYVAVFALLAVWELHAPRRKLLIGRKPRWPNNLGILAVDALAVRLLVPTAAVGIALVAAEREWGLFAIIGLSFWPQVVLGFVVLDLVIYGQHYVFHHVPVLWRLHRMHHADLDIDVTTGVRFHPLEILLSLAIKIAWWSPSAFPRSRSLFSRSCSTPPRCSTTATWRCRPRWNAWRAGSW